MNWKFQRRETGLIEFICEHNVGHPSLGSALWIAESFTAEDSNQDIEGMQRVWASHGCDGCCSEDDFPGTWFHSMRAAHKIIRSVMDELQEAATEQIVRELSEGE